LNLLNRHLLNPLTASQKKGLFSDWKKASALVCMTKLMIHNVTGKQSLDTRYYLTSLKDVNDAAHCIRAHWNILCEIYFNAKELEETALQTFEMQVA